jgi:hypothetical protein
MTMPASTGQARHPRGIIGVLPYLLDIVIPLVSYYVLTSVGLSPFWSLMTGGALTSIISLINTIRRGKIDKLGVLVIAEIVLGLVLNVAVHSARFALASRSLDIALAGIWVLASAFTGRPVTVDATKPIAAKKAGENGIIAVEWLAENSNRFLRIHRMLAAIWGTTFLAYAAIRVILIYNVNISKAVWLTDLPGILAIAICLIVSKQAGKHLETLVNNRLGHSEHTLERSQVQAGSSDLAQ